MCTAIRAVRVWREGCYLVILVQEKSIQIQFEKLDMGSRLYYMGDLDFDFRPKITQDRCRDLQNTLKSLPYDSACIQNLLVQLLQSGYVGSYGVI